MGWASGSSLFGEVWSLLREFVPPADRRKKFDELVDLFEGYDCDTICEVADQWPEGEEWLQEQREEY